LIRVDHVATLNRAFHAAPPDIYRCADGWIVTSVIGARMFRRWAGIVGEAHWLADPRLADHQASADHGDIIGALMRAWCGAHSCAEALAARKAAQIVAAEVYSPQQALDDPHTGAAHLLEEQNHPSRDGTFPLVPTPIELSETPGTYRGPAPPAYTPMGSWRASATRRRTSPRRAPSG
jgi:crotonobetainyl-CoA:carnitine CoA-transferase CaiB-like acyl-CoA transferase